MARRAAPCAASLWKRPSGLRFGPEYPRLPRWTRLAVVVWVVRLWRGHGVRLWPPTATAWRLRRPPEGSPSWTTFTISKPFFLLMVFSLSAALDPFFLVYHSTFCFSYIAFWFCALGIDWWFTIGSSICARIRVLWSLYFFFDCIFVVFSERSARSTFPRLKNFRVAKLRGFRRVFAHVAPIFFDRGIAIWETKVTISLFLLFLFGGWGGGVVGKGGGVGY